MKNVKMNKIGLLILSILLTTSIQEVQAGEKYNHLTIFKFYTE